MNKFLVVGKFETGSCGTLTNFDAVIDLPNLNIKNWVSHWTSRRRQLLDTRTIARSCFTVRLRCGKMPELRGS
jgi:hypothetical protein